MKVIDCPWELENIGKHTVEIAVESTDIFNKESIKSAIDGYEYAVIKVDMNKPSFNIGLSGQGFTCMEVQMHVGIEYDDFDFSKIYHLYNDTRFEVVDSESEFHTVMSHIQPGMFSTDRITIDPHFSEALGCRRYKNWLSTEYYSQNSLLVKIIYKRENVGFMLVRINKEKVNLLLNGLYKPYQGKGIGMLTPASPMIFIKQYDLPIKKETTSISSNNIPVVKLYNRLGFQILNQTYVFVKHK